jgi:diacylglycerol kinase (ATP)
MLRSGSGVTGVGTDTVDATAPKNPAKTARYARSEATTVPVAALRQLGAIRRAVIVVNDLAPSARSEDWRALVSDKLGDGFEVTLVRVRSFEGAAAAARGAAAWGAKLVLAVGGDGTVNACVNGVGESRTRIAVVPAGTANDLCRLLGQSRLGDACGIEHWERREIDAISCDGVRYYSAGGLGFVADVAATANRWRAGGPVQRWLLGRLGSVLYTLACVAVILLSRRLGGRYKLRYTDAATGEVRELEADAYGVIATNCARVGESFQLTPESDMQDGAFELILFPRTTRLRLLKTILWAQRGKLFDLPEIRWLQVTDAQIASDVPQQFFGDGEILRRGTRFDLALADTPIRLMAPVAAEPEPLFDLGSLVGDAA